MADVQPVKFRDLPIGAKFQAEGRAEIVTKLSATSYEVGGYVREHVEADGVLDSLVIPVPAPFESGDRVYLKDGRAATYEAEAGSRHAVYVVLEDEYGQEFDGPLELVEQVYRKAPTAKLDAEVASLLSQKKALEEAVHGIRVEKSRIEREIAACDKSFARHPALKKLRDFIDGKITHFAIIDSSYNREATVLAKEVALKDDSWHMRLLSLYGDSKGDLAWRINTYRDGSGSDRTAIPATSLEEAQEIAKATLLGWEADVRGGKDDWRLERYLDSRRALGMDVPADLVEKSRAYKVKCARQEADRKKAEYEKAQAELDAALAEGQVPA